MAKNNNFDDDILIDQPEIGCYYHNNMFRFPENDLMRPQPPSMKGTSMKGTNMMNQGTFQTPGMMNQSPSQSQGMMNQGPAQTPGMMNQAPQGEMDMTFDEQTTLSPTLNNTAYTQGFLRTLIGKRVRISFLIGTSLLVDRVGTLLEVGISYVLMRQLDANINVMGDLYSIKFVDIYNA